MLRQKILNDPVYGFIDIPSGIIFQLIEHPYFQRLRRIKQVSLTHYVYPGALHTRFHHALGALHLMQQAIRTLREKGVEITPEEAEGVSIAILLHDIGHGPFSHTLEHTLIQVHHERISALFMEKLNEEFQGALSLAIQIFRDEYPKKFLSQLVSGQLDMDRLDYLTRDSFFTGVYEGVIGYDRIIKMLSVHDGELVVEEKGIYSVEKFLISRRLMYWQVYLHKTVLSAEQMLVRTLQRARHLATTGWDLPGSPPLRFFLTNTVTENDFDTNRDTLLEYFAALDDFDIVAALKNWMYAPDRVLAFLAQSLINRRLFKLELQNTPIAIARMEEMKQQVAGWWNGQAEDIPYLVFAGQESNNTYNTQKAEIQILYKNGEVRPMSTSVDFEIQPRNTVKYYLCYPKMQDQPL
ncbi:MAG: HD domain-containing protein [Lewinellaceae bacterium]|nr:HD domain-containing protein [Lewinellaceae bacterium]